ncbi:GNAT family N-acetyltransferase [Anaeromicropila herbilytica]|uniref:N-acetyltransferase domain-containing protein n=1 Tax=Anaeromicropila herbilytica TaxID=2785025 RepID=A0A7R7IES8_9FIRM|nr:GNAT family N-acetyltransferase [Anaeromicropila herbilytica]BCN32346.1 hypothetical protein bsdtb5_36410 [Anaeromicropila herbilytica]
MENNNITMKELKEEEQYNFYQTYLIHDFPESEVKPYDIIEESTGQGKYISYGFFRNLEPLGYAFMTKAKENGGLLMDYFAVIDKHRSKGLGSSIVETIKRELQGRYESVIIEVENPEVEMDEKKKEVRNRRIAFYLKNGFKMSNIQSRVLTDEYLIMTLELGKELEERQVYLELQAIYQALFGFEFFENNICMSL